MYVCRGGSNSGIEQVSSEDCQCIWRRHAAFGRRWEKWAQIEDHPYVWGIWFAQFGQRIQIGSDSTTLRSKSGQDAESWTNWDDIWQPESQMGQTYQSGLLLWDVAEFCAQDLRRWWRVKLKQLGIVRLYRRVLVLAQQGGGIARICYWHRVEQGTQWQAGQNNGSHPRRRAEVWPWTDCIKFQAIYSDGRVRFRYHFLCYQQNEECQ